MSDEAVYRVIYEDKTALEARVRGPAPGKEDIEVEIGGIAREVSPKYSLKAAVAFAARHAYPLQHVQHVEVLAPGEASRDEMEAALAAASRGRDAAHDLCWSTIEKAIRRIDEAKVTTGKATDEARAARGEVDRLTREAEDGRWSANAHREDLAQLSRVMGRSTWEMLFENGAGARQTPTVHVLGDGRAYAPILGGEATLCTSADALGRELEPLLGNGFKFIRVQKHGTESPK